MSIKHSPVSAAFEAVRYPPCKSGTLTHISERIRWCGSKEEVKGRTGGVYSLYTIWDSFVDF